MSFIETLITRIFAFHYITAARGMGAGPQSNTIGLILTISRGWARRRFTRHKADRHYYEHY
jgi:hypothetical protein